LELKKKLQRNKLVLLCGVKTRQPAEIYSVVTGASVVMVSLRLEVMMSFSSVS